jgi:hypothetical protein
MWWKGGKNKKFQIYTEDIHHTSAHSHSDFFGLNTEQVCWYGNTLSCTQEATGSTLSWDILHPQNKYGVPQNFQASSGQYATFGYDRMSFLNYDSLIILRFSAMYAELLKVTSYWPVNVNTVEDLNFHKYCCEIYYLTRQFLILQNGMPTWGINITGHNAAACPLIYTITYPTNS